MTRSLLTVASIAVSLAALIARAIAIGLSDLDRGLRGYRTDPVPDCTHVDQVRVTELPEEVAGCEDCLAAGGGWVHLRICLTCGHVGCCDSSPHRHAAAHFTATAHPVVASAEQRERWAWCYADSALLLPAP